MKVNWKKPKKNNEIKWNSLGNNEYETKNYGTRTGATSGRRQDMDISIHLVVFVEMWC